jgi:hypothetical protein
VIDVRHFELVLKIGNGTKAPNDDLCAYPVRVAYGQFIVRVNAHVGQVPHSFFNQLNPFLGRE